MPHTDDEIEYTAGRFEQLADELAPVTAEVEHTDDLREIAAASEAARADQARLRELSRLPVRTASRGTRSRWLWVCPDRPRGNGS